MWIITYLILIFIVLMVLSSMKEASNLIEEQRRLINKLNQKEIELELYKQSKNNIIKIEGDNNNVRQQ